MIGGAGEASRGAGTRFWAVRRAVEPRWVGRPGARRRVERILAGAYRRRRRRQRILGTARLSKRPRHLLVRRRESAVARWWIFAMQHQLECLSQRWMICP